MYLTCFGCDVQYISERSILLAKYRVLFRNIVGGPIIEKKGKAKENKEYFEPRLRFDNEQWPVNGNGGF